MVSTSRRCLPAPRWRRTWKWLRKNCTLSTPRASRGRRAACSATPTCACTRVQPWACTSNTLLPPPFYPSSPSPLSLHLLPQARRFRETKKRAKTNRRRAACYRGGGHGPRKKTLLTSPLLHAFSFLKAGKMEKSGRRLFALCISWSVVSLHVVLCSFLVEAEHRRVLTKQKGDRHYEDSLPVWGGRRRASWEDLAHLIYLKRKRETCYS